ncbi:MAG: aminopeptidase, partial [Oscillospiraceae bacterium]
FIEGNIESCEIMNAIALRAYEKGAKFVFLNCGNRLMENAKAKYWTAQSYKDYPYLGETVSFMAAYSRKNAKIISLHDYFSEDQTGVSQKQLSDYPNALMAGKEAAFKSKSEALSQLLPTEDNTNSVYAKSEVAVPTKTWAQKVYPELSGEAAYYQLADDIFNFMYVTEEGSTMIPQLENIEKRRNKFNEMEITSLHYSSATLDFDVPLHKNNIFASMPQRKGDDILAGNIPSVEIFGMPTKYGANGTVQNTRPLVVNDSQVVDGIKMEFKDGKLINYSVEKNPEAFEAIVASMPEGVYMGEISMVPCDSPIFQTGEVYYSTLIDENAASHFAIGAAFPDSNLKEGIESDEDVNMASDHIDIVIGSEDLTVTATLKDGTKVDLIKDGVWTVLD